MADVSKIQLPDGSEYNIKDTSKQPLLVSGTNIKTVNSSSLLGSGNLSVGTVTSVQAGNGLSISGTSTTNPTVNIGSNYKLPTTNEWNAKAPLASPALTGTPTAPTADAGTNTTQIATTAFVKTAIDNLPEPMLFKGSVGTDGTVTWANLPSAAAGNEGWTYKVITAHSADTKCPACKVGDTIISNGSTWTVIPSGDEPSGTVTSVGLSVPTGFSVSGSPVTSSGTLALSFASGYSLPTTAKQTNWDTAYSHATSKGSAFSLGLYKITTNSEGHVTAATAVAKSDITALGIPGSDTNTTYTLSSGSGTQDDTKIILTPSSGSAQKITVPYASTAGSATSAGSAPWTGITEKPTTLSGYGITDAKIASGTITLGSSTITPLTSHQTVALAPGTNNGTLKLVTAAGTTDNIAVKGLGSNAYTSTAYVAKTGDTMTGVLNIKAPAAGLLSLYRTDASGGAFIDYYHAGQTSSYWRVGSDINGNLLFVSYPGSYYRLCVKPNGNIGVGTESPSYKLDVAGTIRAINASVMAGTTVYAGTNVRAAGGDVYIGSASGSQCHQQYDATNKCLKFIFD